MKMKIKTCVKLSVFIMIFCLLFNYCDKVLMVKLLDQPWDNYYKTTGFFEEPEESLDVIFFGSSIAFCDLNPMELWHSYGITSYNFSNGAQAIQVSDYYLREALKRQNPRVVVLECSNFANTLDETDVNTVLVWNLETMPLSYKKLCLVNDYVKRQERVGAVFSISFYHTRWKELNQRDYQMASEAGGRNIYKGASVAFAQGGGKIYESITNRNPEDCDYEVRDGIEINDTTREYLIRFIEYAKKNGCNVVLVKNPQIGDWSADYADSIRAIADEYGAEFWDFADPSDIPLDLYEHYMDASHMNYWGNVEYSIRIGGLLCEKFDLDDRRDNGEYSYWWDDYEVYEELITEGLREYEQTLQTN